MGLTSSTASCLRRHRRLAHDLREYEPYYVEWEKAWGVTGTNQGPFSPRARTTHCHLTRGARSPNRSRCTARPWVSPLPDAHVSRIAAIREPVWCRGQRLRLRGLVRRRRATTSARPERRPIRPTGPSLRRSARGTSHGPQQLRLPHRHGPQHRQATGARYYDAAGNIHVQPAKVVYNGLWGFNIIRTMRLSGIGNPYNNTTFQGSLGRAPSYGDPAPGVRASAGT